MSNIKWSYQLLYNITIALMLLTLGAPKLNSLAIVVFAIATIFGAIKKQLVFRFNTILLLLIALYLCYVIGFFFTDNQQVAGKYLEYKMALALLPILFSFTSTGIFNYKVIFLGLLGGISVFGGLGLIDAFQCFGQQKLITCFNSSLLSTAIHPSYMAAFVAIAIIILFFQYKEKTGIKNKWLLLVLIGILTIYSLFLMSLAGMLFLALLYAIFIFIYFYQRFKWKGIFFSFVTLIIVGSVVTQIMPAKVKNEFTAPLAIVNEAFSHPKDYIQSRKYPISGSETRLMMWMMSTELLKEYPFGVGLGDLDDEFEYRFKKQNQLEFSIQHYNPHNQFLQLALELGIPVLLLLIVILFLIIKTAVKNRNWILLVVTANLIFNCLFESMLQRQYGLIFYLLLICVLLPKEQILLKNKS